MGLKLRNNAVGVLSDNVSAVATTVVLSAGHGDNSPSLSTNDWFPMTVVRPGVGQEIMRTPGDAEGRIQLCYSGRDQLRQAHNNLQPTFITNYIIRT